MGISSPGHSWRMRTGMESAEERALQVASAAPRIAVAIARQITRLGDRTPVWAAVGVAGLAQSVRQRRVVPVVCALGTLAAGAGLRGALAVQLNRERPPERFWRMEWSGPSFPSRHTTMATLGAGLVAGCLTSTQPSLARLVRWAPSVGVGMSRVVLGVHWPSDVAAGWLYAATVLSASRRLRAAAGIAS